MFLFSAMKNKTEPGNVIAQVENTGAPLVIPREETGLFTLTLFASKTTWSKANTFLSYTKSKPLICVLMKWTYIIKHEVPVFKLINVLDLLNEVTGLKWSMLWKV